MANIPDPEPGKAAEPQQDITSHAEAGTVQGQTPSAAGRGGDELTHADYDVLTEAQQLHQHHVSKILDEVLEDSDETPTASQIKHPMLLDLVLAISFLVAMGGFSLGLIKMYIVHHAQESIMRRDFKSAIGVLKGLPLPGFIAVPGASPESDPQELLNQALYLDGIDKLDNKTDINGALNELQQIQASSRYFPMAQEALNENFEPSSTLLKMEVEHTEKNPPAPDKKRFSPELPHDATP